MVRSRVQVAHAYNPSYSGGRDQENYGSKPARVNNLKTLSWKKPIINKAQGVGPEFKAW
jgi:hypothetical protein